MKKATATLSLSLILGLTFLIPSCTETESNETSEEEAVNEKAVELDLTISPIDQKGIDFVASINLDDSVSYYEPKNFDAAGLADYYRNQEKYVWDMLIRMEKVKFNNIDRLIQEISYNPKHNPAEVAKAEKIALKIKSFIMLKSDLKDQVKDSLFDAYLTEIYKIGDETESMENYPLYKQLKDDISDNLFAIEQLRVAHSKSIDQLNRNIDSLKPQLTPLGLDTSLEENYY